MNSVIVIAVWQNLPIMILLFLARLQTVPAEALEAAVVDGANSWQVFRYITLPWMMPMVFVAVMLRTIFSFNEFDVPFLLTHGGPLGATLVLPVLVRALLLEQLSLGRAAALSVVMVGILVAFGLLFRWGYRLAESRL
jgi:ABC-type sugar transport system permease subunit